MLVAVSRIADEVRVELAVRCSRHQANVDVVGDAEITVDRAVGEFDLQQERGHVVADAAQGFGFDRHSFHALRLCTRLFT